MIRANDYIEKMTLSFEPAILRLSGDGKFSMTSQCMTGLSFTTDIHVSPTTEQKHQLEVMKKVVEKLKEYGYRAEIKIERKTTSGGFGMYEDDEPPREFKDHYIAINW